ncbi:15565_t:CDS:10, partial [Gigaspora margarita]
MVDYNKIKNELTNAKRTIKRLNQKIIKLSDTRNKTNDHKTEKIKLEKIVKNKIENMQIGSTILVDTSQYIYLILSQPCINCKSTKLSAQSWYLKTFSFSLKSQILCNNCSTTIMQTNEKKEIKYSHAVAAAGLGGSISCNAIQSVLSILGVTSQSCKKTYHTYQSKMFNNLVLYAKESATNALTNCLDYIEKNHKEKILSISFDCSWAHGRNTKQASGEFLYQIKTNDFLIDICVDGDLDTNKTLSRISIVNQIFADLKHVVKNIRKALENSSKLTLTEEELRELQIEGLIKHLCNNHSFCWDEFCWIKEDSSITLREPTLENFTSLKIVKFCQMLQTIFHLPIGQGLVTTNRTLANELFNRVKLVYLNKKIDYWNSYRSRHALAVLHNNEGYLYILFSLRELYGTVPYSEEDIKNIGLFKLEHEQQQLRNIKTIHKRNQNRAKQYELEKKELIGFDFSQELILYKYKEKDRLRSNTFYSSFASLIPDFEAIVRCYSCNIFKKKSAQRFCRLCSAYIELGLNNRLLNNCAKELEISYLTLEQKIKIVTKKIFNFVIRNEQKQAILNYVQNKKDIFIVMKMGRGKTLCYVVLAIFFEGLTVVISPLIALIQNQITNLVQAGIPCGGLYTSLVGTLNCEKKIFHEIAIGFTKILFITPEKLMLNKSFQVFLTRLYQDRKVQFAIDEVHCVLDYANFRKSYRQLFYLKDSYPEASIMMLTATCFFEEMNLIRENLHILENNFTYIYANNQVRSELIYEVKKNTKGIECQKVREELRKRLENETFGMGIDTPNVRLVIHYTFPTTNLIQQSGCAGRDSLPAKIPCDHCNNCYIQNKKNAKVVDASTEVLEMLGIVETLTTQFEHQIIPEDIVSVFNRANTIRLNMQIMAQIILDDLVVKSLKPKANTSYLTLSTIITGLEEEAKSRVALQEWPYW